MIRQIALGGLGVGVLPPMLVHDDLAAGRVVRLLPKWSIGSEPLYVAYPSRRYLPQKVRAFVDHLTERVTSTAVHGPRPP